MYSFRKSKKGFTLIELMVVVAIIAVLALLGLRMYSTQQAKAKTALVKANAGTVQVAIQTELVDEPGLLLATIGADLTDLSVLQNPFNGHVNYAADGAWFINLVAASGNEGMVGVTQDTSSFVFTITGYGEGGELIDNYTLTAQR